MLQSTLNAKVVPPAVSATADDGTPLLTPRLCTVTVVGAVNVQVNCSVQYLYGRVAMV